MQFLQADPRRQPRALLRGSSEGIGAGGEHQDWSPGWAGGTEGMRSPKVSAKGCGKEGRAPRRGSMEGGAQQESCHPRTTEEVPRGQGRDPGKVGMQGSKATGGGAGAGWAEWGGGPRRGGGGGREGLESTFLEISPQGAESQAGVGLCAVKTLEPWACLCELGKIQKVGDKPQDCSGTTAKGQLKEVV